LKHFVIDRTIASFACERREKMGSRPHACATGKHAIEPHEPI